MDIELSVQGGNYLVRKDCCAPLSIKFKKFPDLKFYLSCVRSRTAPVSALVVIAA